jgi:hypothetical protein
MNKLDAILREQEQMKRTRDRLNKRYGSMDTEPGTAAPHAEAAGHQDGDSDMGAVSAANLCATVFAPVRWAVPGILPAGVTLLAGAPKAGKSWLALDFGIAIASGGKVLGKTEVDPGAVLYLALEDNPRRLQSRLKKRLAGAAPPGNLYFKTEWPRVDQDAAERLQEWMARHPDTRLIIIDTLARIRPPSKKSQQLYEADYAIGKALLRLASDKDVAIVLVTHTKKGQADDPLELISGSTGLTGGVDNAIVLQRTRGSDEASLYVCGRDIDKEAKYELQWDQQTAAWTVTGEGPHVGLSPERRRVFDIIAEHGPINGKEITRSLHPGVDITRGCREWTAVRQLLNKLQDSGFITPAADGFITTTAHTTTTGNTIIRVSPVSPVTPITRGDPRVVEGGVLPRDAVAGTTGNTRNPREGAGSGGRVTGVTGDRVIVRGEL